MSDRVLMRTMTRKSILGFGAKEYRELSIGMLIDTGRAWQLIQSYFNLDKINFTDELLNELGITKDIRLKKPSKCDSYDEGKRMTKIALANRKSNMSEKEILYLSAYAKRAFKLKTDNIRKGIRYSNSKGVLQNKNLKR